MGNHFGNEFKFRKKKILNNYLSQQKIRNVIVLIFNIFMLPYTPPIMDKFQFLINSTNNFNNIYKHKY